MPMPVHPACLDEARLLADCDLTPVRRSGPGGQHRNTTFSGLVVTHRPTGVSAEAGERRRQSENRIIAVRRLRVKLALAVREPADAPREPSELWRSRCRGGQVSVNPAHHDFPALLAEVLDFLSAEDMDVPAAAGRLGCTPSQLVKLLKLEPAALELVNRRRSERQLHPLR